jgi:hypothetical protein
MAGASRRGSAWRPSGWREPGYLRRAATTRLATTGLTGCGRRTPRWRASGLTRVRLAGCNYGWRTWRRSSWPSATSISRAASRTAAA